MGFDAPVGKWVYKLKCFSFPFNSVIFTVIGNRALKAVAVKLVKSVAVKVLAPILTFILTIHRVIIVVTVVVSSRSIWRAIFITECKCHQKNCKCVFDTLYLLWLVNL